MSEFSNQTQKENAAKSESRIADLMGPELELQSRIDDVIVSRFDMGDVTLPVELVDSLEQRQAELRSNLFSRRAVMLVAVASLIGVCVFGAWQLVLMDRSPFFQVQPLGSIYNECLERGFKPNDNCHQIDRVEGAFFHLHDAELTLAMLPEDRKLKGISHLGGLSRHTFAVLFEGPESPAIVFIDKAKYDDPRAVNLPEDSGLNIFSKVSGKFLLYEVSMDSESMFLEFLDVADQ